MPALPTRDLSTTALEPQLHRHRHSARGVLRAGDRAVRCVGLLAGVEVEGQGCIWISWIEVIQAIERLGFEIQELAFPDFERFREGYVEILYSGTACQRGRRIADA